MRRHLVLAFSIFCTAAILAACGDAGDHFGEFRKQPQPTPTPKHTPTPTPTGPVTPTPRPTKPPTPTPSPTPVPAVKRLVLSMPATPNPLSPGTFTLVVAAYNSAGQLMKTGTVLQNPIQLTSNSSCSISFVSPTGGGTSLTLPTAPGSVNINYSPPSATCTPPSHVTILGFDLDANPNSTSFSILGGTETVTSIAMDFLGLPSPNSAGVYPLFINPSSKGKPIPFGITLTNPIQLSSNASCSVGFGITLNPNTYTQTYRLTSTQTQVYVSFDPTNPNCNAPAGGKVGIQAIASGTPPVNSVIRFRY
jgi:hypothetical protein